MVLLAAIPITVFFLQQQQTTESSASAPSTRIYFRPDSSAPIPLKKNVGDSFDLELWVDPGENYVTHLILKINYDQSKISTTTAGLVLTTGMRQAKPLTYSDGSIFVDLDAVGAPGAYIQTATKIGTLSLKALAETPSTQITFVGSDAQSSQTEADAPVGGSILSSTLPAFIAIGASAVTTPTLTPVPTSPPSSPSATPAPVGAAPVCTSLNIDRAPSGSTPFSVTFTAVGTATDTTISKATFNFGDGPNQDVDQSGGIGTKSISVQTAHTYNNPGTFTATVTLTGANGQTSSVATCTKVITVLAPTQAPAVGGNQPVVQQPTPVVEQQPISSPGPADDILKAGGVAAILSILGAVLFFAL